MGTHLVSFHPLRASRLPIGGLPSERQCHIRACIVSLLWMHPDFRSLEFEPRFVVAILSSRLSLWATLGTNGCFLSLSLAHSLFSLSLLALSLLCLSLVKASRVRIGALPLERQRYVRPWRERLMMLDCQLNVFRRGLEMMKLRDLKDCMVSLSRFCSLFLPASASALFRWSVSVTFVPALFRFRGRYW